MKIATFSDDNSSGESIVSLVKILIERKNDYQVFSFARGPSVKAYERENLPIMKKGYLNPDFLTVESITNYLKSNLIEVIVVGTSPQSLSYRRTSEQIATMAARNLGIPTISLLDYMGIDQRRRYSDIPRQEFPAVQAKDLIYLPTIIATPDFWTLEQMIREGFPREILRNTGNPQHDALNILKEMWGYEKTQKVKDDLGIPQEGRVVTMIGSVKSDWERDKSGFWDYDIISAVSEGIKKSQCEDVIFLVRPHPRQIITDEESWNKVILKAKESGLKYVIDSRKPYDPHHVSLASFLTIGARSNVMADAARMDLENLSLQPGAKDHDHFGPSLMGAIPTAYTYEDAVDYVTRALTTPQEFFAHYSETRKPLKVDGKATERVIELIDELS